MKDDQNDFHEDETWMGSTHSSFNVDKVSISSSDENIFRDTEMVNKSSAMYTKGGLVEFRYYLKSFFF